MTHIPLTLACAGLLGASLFALTSRVVSSAGSAPSASSNLTAISAGPEVEFPSSASYGFEQLAVIDIGTGDVTSGPWKISNGGGVAVEGTPFLGVPEGIKAAYVYNGSNVDTTFTFPHAGIWRLRFRAAQESGSSPQVIRARVGGVTLLERAPDAVAGVDPWDEMVTRPFTVNAGQLTRAVRFRGVAPGNDAAFLDAVYLEPIASWQDSATWGGVLPSNGDALTIPDGVEVAVTGACAADTVAVHGELLVTNRDSSLTAREVLVGNMADIMIAPEAKFEVGQAGAPFEEDFELLLVGLASQDPLSGMGTKFLGAVNNGQIDMHGAPKTSWTYLTSTAAASTNVIEVEDATGWAVGDWIVLTATNYQIPNGSYQDQAEMMEIAAVSGNQLTLGETLQHTHVSGAAIPVDNAVGVLLQRAEVGMLSHNVRVVGSIPEEQVSPDRFGGHVMLMRTAAPAPGVMPEPGGRGRFSSVEFADLGQETKVGRYPIHWHMQLDGGEGQYFVDSSIHHSFNRAATIHGTERVRLERNVAYSHVGHGVFLEDGSERFNEIHDNLVLGSIRPNPLYAVVPTDAQPNQPQNRTPSSFWIANPMNYVTGNVAAGTQGSGYWFAFPEAPLQLSSLAWYFDTIPSPLEEDLGEFDENVAHSCAMGFDVNDSVNPGLSHEQTLISNADWLPENQAVLERFVVWGCGTGIYTGENHGDLVFKDCVLADNQLNIDFAGYHLVDEAVVIADTGNGIMQPSDKRYAYVIYHNAKVSNTEFHGFDAAPRSFFFNRGGAQRQTNAFLNNVELFPPGPYIDTCHGSQACDYSVGGGAGFDPREWTVSIRDVHGDITGIAVTTIVSNHSFMLTGLETALPSATFPSGPDLMLASPYKFAHLRLTHLGSGGNAIDLTATRIDRNGLLSDAVFDYPPSIHGIDKKKQLPLIADTSAASLDEFDYRLDWRTDLQQGESFQIIVDGVEEYPATDIVRFTMKLINIGPITPSATIQWTPSVSDTVATLVPANSMLELELKTRTSYWYDALSEQIHFRFYGVNDVEGHIVELTW